MGSNISHVQNEDCVHSFSALTTPDADREWSYVVVDDRMNETAAPLVRDIESTTSDQYDTSIETNGCTINLNKVDIKPRTRVRGIPGRADATLMSAPSPTGQSNVIQHVCKTQPYLQDSLRSIYVGENGTAHRFVRGSVITFNINHGSFPNPRYAKHATKSLEKAADAWNWGDFGVSFQRVPDDRPAVFQLSYSEEDGGDPRWLAQAFFPYRVRREKQPQLRVLPSAFEQANYNRIVNILCHELGHVLGLRHQFAQTDPRELHMSSVRIGEDDVSSVMNYFTDLSLLCIQKSDFDGVREFYAFDGECYRGFMVEEVVPREFAPSHRIASRSSSSWSLVSCGT